MGIYLCEKDRCTGCLACVNACQHEAISVQKDELGFIRPEIDEKACKECGLCEKSCPEINPVKTEIPLKFLAAYNRNYQEAQTCSSGGIASVIAKYMNQKGGFVCGAMFDDSNNPVMKVATTAEDINKLKGSKYVQCFAGHIYSDVKKRLEGGQQGVFIGTPCQVAGLLKFLRKPYQGQLTTIDLICHGTPAAEYLYQHIKKHAKRRKVAKISFRGENDFCLCLRDTNDNIVYNGWKDDDVYFASFLSGVTYRESCYKCRYACLNRVSDITLGDFWGVDRKKIGDYIGRVSLVLCNSPIGNELIEKISESIVVFESTCEEAIKQNKQLTEPSEKHPERDRFCQAYKATKNFDKAIAQTGVRRKTQISRILRRVAHIKHGLKKVIRTLDGCM